ncbi:hypothetical protein EIM38_24735, partial [Salmonella enterica subsp. enterica serovar Typhimurium]|nr:hypothetical protein [Salmonella enterica subsp. enterica serovar Typhimurium]
LRAGNLKMFKQTAQGSSLCQFHMILLILLTGLFTRQALARRYINVFHPAATKPHTRLYVF